MKTYLFFMSVILIGTVFLSIPSARPSGNSYQFPWPGILPDNPLYTLKILRNRIIPRLIMSPVKKIEFDLLMTDKTLYASKLLLDKGESTLAAETALKGENYFTILVSDYATALWRKDVIPFSLLNKIQQAYVAQKELIRYLMSHSKGASRDIFNNVHYFSESNYQSFIQLQKNPRH